MSTRAQTLGGTDVIAFGDTPGDNDNPLLESVPAVPTLPEAMRLTEIQETQDVTGWSIQELIAHEAANSFVTEATRAGVFIDAVTQVRSSYRDRDLRDPRYRDHAISANHFLHRNRDKRGHVILSRFSIAPRARPRGIVVVSPVQTGRRRLADMVASALGTEPRVTRIAATTGFTEYLQLPVLRMTWPIDGKLSGFAQGFIGAFDAAFQTEYANNTRTPLFRERDIVPAICALGVASNLGLLMVERINMQDTCNSAADSTWNAIAQFTRTTGIPVLCLATPGAVAASLARLPGVVGDLTPTGLIEITASRSPREKHWIAVCLAIFDRTMRIAGIASMPAWLPDAAYDLTSGYPGPLARALTAIAIRVANLQTPIFTPEIFTKYGGQALALDQPHLDAVRTFRGKGIYKPSSLIRHGDWLSLSQLKSTHLLPEPR
jgi:hypothetical protein